MTDKEIMQAALNALEMYWVKAEHLRTKVDDAQARQAVFALQARLGQTEDEPVSLKPCRSPYCECDSGECTHPGFYDARDKPQPAAWVGLTDEEIKEIIGPWGDVPIKGYTRKLFDQIETKLKEKNNGL